MKTGDKGIKLFVYIFIIYHARYDHYYYILLTMKKQRQGGPKIKEENEKEKAEKRDTWYLEKSIRRTCKKRYPDKYL